MKFEKVQLRGKWVHLEPLVENHKDGLCKAIYDGELWKLYVTRIPHPRDIDKFYEHADKAFSDGHSLVFTTIDQITGNIVGSTRFFRTDFSNRRVEIGSTFIAKSFQRTAINTEAKLLMLTYAFDTLEFNRVEFLTDFLNHRSRTAILRLGAKEEGILRNHIVMPDGRIRDSVLFSIISNEWPGIKQHLQNKLNSYSK